MIEGKSGEDPLRLTAAKGAADLPPLLLDAAGVPAWLGRHPRPWNNP